MPATKTGVWNAAGAGIARYECAPPQCAARIILFRFEKSGFSWRFENQPIPKTVQAWSESMKGISFVANGVFFDEKWQPTGMLKTKGKTVNGRSYDPELSGILELSPDVRVIDTAKEKYDLGKMTETAQSFPLIIKSGLPVGSFKDVHAARRTVFGVDTEGNSYVGIVPEDSVSFPNLAKILAGTGVSWNNVINLDGGTSTGFALRSNGASENIDSIVQVPNVIVAERK
jgi:hypothetical protein